MRKVQNFWRLQFKGQIFARNGPKMAMTERLDATADLVLRRRDSVHLRLSTR